MNNIEQNSTAVQYNLISLLSISNSLYTYICFYLYLNIFQFVCKVCTPFKTSMKQSVQPKIHMMISLLIITESLQNINYNYHYFTYDHLNHSGLL